MHQTANSNQEDTACKDLYKQLSKSLQRKDSTLVIVHN